MVLSGRCPGTVQVTEDIAGCCPGTAMVLLERNSKKSPCAKLFFRGAGCDSSLTPARLVDALCALSERRKSAQPGTRNPEMG